MRFLDKGRSASSEAKKAAYRLLDEASQLKHKEAMKLIGISLSLIVEKRFIDKSSRATHFVFFENYF